MEAQEIDLLDFLKTIWKRKFFIVGGVIICTLISVIYSFSLPKIYQATVTILVSTSPVVPSSQQIPDFERLIETYRAVIKNKSALISVIEKFKPSGNSPPFSLELLDNIISVKPVPNSRLIRLDVELKDPKLASEIANYLAENAVILNMKLNQGDTLEAQRFLKEELAKTKEEFEKAENTYLDFQKNAQMAEQKKQVETLLEIKSNFTKRLAETEVNLNGEIENMKTLGEEIKTREPKISLTQTFINDTAYREILSAISDSRERDLLKLKLNSEAVNEAYGELDRSLVFSRAQVASLKSNHETLKSALHNINKGLSLAQVKLAKNQIEEQRLNNHYTLSSSIYQDFMRKLEEANINVVGQSKDIKILDPAIVSDRPIKPKKKVIVIITFLLAGTGFVLLAFLLEFFQKMKKDLKNG